MNCRSGTSIRLTDRVRDEAIRRAAQHYGVPACVWSFHAMRRRGPMSRAKLAMWLLRQIRRANGEIAYVYPEIGLSMERDHTAVLNACAKVEGRLAPDELEFLVGIWPAMSNVVQPQGAGNRDRAQHVQCGVGSLFPRR